MTGRIGGIVARRLVQALLVALLVGTLCFLMIRLLPGDLAYRIAAGRYGYDLVSAAAADAVRAELGLDRPAIGAWASWFGHLLRLDLGTSFVTGRPVWEEVREGLGHTLALSAAALGLSLLIGPPLGLWAGLRPHGLVDRATLALAVLLRSLPPFLIGVLLIILLAVRVHVLPAGGHTDDGAIVLPALTLALGLSAVSLRITRNATVAVVRGEHYLFARTKGLPRRRLVARHVLRNVGVPVIGYLGYQATYLAEGVVVVETLFAWPGIGHALVHAIFGRDVPVLQGTALMMGLLFVLLNLGVDLASLWIDPRLRDR